MSAKATHIDQARRALIRALASLADACICGARWCWGTTKDGTREMILRGAA